MKVNLYYVLCLKHGIWQKLCLLQEHNLIFKNNLNTYIIRMKVFNLHTTL